MRICIYSVFLNKNNFAYFKLDIIKPYIQKCFERNLYGKILINYLIFVKFVNHFPCQNFVHGTYV